MNKKGPKELDLICSGHKSYLFKFKSRIFVIGLVGNDSGLCAIKRKKIFTLFFAFKLLFPFFWLSLAKIIIFVKLKQ